MIVPDSCESRRIPAAASAGCDAGAARVLCGVGCGPRIEDVATKVARAEAVRNADESTFHMRRRPIWGIARVSIPVVIISVILGFVIKQPFVESLMAGVATVGLGSMVGVFLVDKFVESDRKALWSKSRNYLLAGIASHLSDTAIDILFAMPVRDQQAMAQIMEGRNRPNLSTVEGLRALAEQLRSIKHSPSPDKHLSDYVIDYYEHAKWDLDQIQAILTPMVIQIEADQELIDALVVFDKARRELHNAIISHKLIVTDAPFPALIEFIDASADLYAVLCRSWVPGAGA